MNTNSYRRSEIAFFSDDDVKEAVVELAAASSVTIYCGAGVTIDRTNLGWGDLIYGLLSRLPPTSIASVDAVAIRDRLSPLEQASIFEQLLCDSLVGRAKPVDSTVALLSEMLYTKAGWESGALVRNVVRLAANLSILRKTVKVVTSNYDVYLEEEYEDYAKELKAKQSPDIPGAYARCAGYKRHLQEKKAVGKVGQIEFIYLHGRIRRDGPRSGNLALSESSYHQVRSKVTSELKSAFNKSSLLILGASLTDPPLLEALHATASPKAPTRIALVPATSTKLLGVGGDHFPDLVKLLQRRTTQYGLRLLVPDFHFQIAQFCQEIITCTSMGSRRRAYADRSVNAPERYGARLTAWWEKWSNDPASLDHAAIQRRLYGCLEELAKVRHWSSKSGELYKLELWVRNRPSSERALALWGGSTGTLVDRKILKKDDLEIETKNVSVRAFIEGRPVWLSRDDVDNVDTRPRKREWIKTIQGRWQRYLAVPIRLDDSMDLMLQVGVVTLAAMGPRTNIPIQHVESMVEITRTLESVGRELLDVR